MVNHYGGRGEEIQISQRTTMLEPATVSYSVDLGWNPWLFELLLPFCGF